MREKLRPLKYELKTGCGNPESTREELPVALSQADFPAGQAGLINCIQHFHEQDSLNRTVDRSFFTADCPEKILHLGNKFVRDRLKRQLTVDQFPVLILE